MKTSAKKKEKVLAIVKSGDFKATKTGVVDTAVYNSKGRPPLGEWQESYRLSTKTMKTT